MEPEFEEIYRRYSKDLYRFILKMTQDENLALDIMQDTMLKAAESFDRFRGACAVKTWLCAIARNEYCTWLKMNGSPPVSIHDLPEPAAAVQIAEQTENHDLALQLHTLLRRLEEPYKEVFMLRTAVVIVMRRKGEITPTNKKGEYGSVLFYGLSRH